MVVVVVVVEVEDEDAVVEVVVEELTELVVFVELVVLAELVEAAELAETTELTELVELTELGDEIAGLVPDITASPTEIAGGASSVFLHPTTPQSKPSASAAPSNFVFFIRPLSRNYTCP